MIRLLPGDCRDVLPTLEAGSVHTCVTSPPYYALRSYLDASHPDKHREIGSESTPDEYIQTMVEVFRHIRRVLRDDGCVFCNMGDGYQDKQLLMMPARLALALQADGWWLRSQIVWAKPNPMPESVTDRPTSAYEMVYLFSKRSRYFYDADAVRERVGEETRRNTEFRGESTPYKNGQSFNNSLGIKNYVPAGEPSLNGRSCRNVWTIATQAFSESHYATMPTALVERCIRAGTSERGCCAQCGKPWVRVTETTYTPGGPKHSGNAKALRYIRDGEREDSGYKTRHDTTTGWQPGCQCKTLRCVACFAVLDTKHENRKARTANRVPDVRRDVPPVGEAGEILQSSLLRHSAEEAEAYPVSSVRDGIHAEELPPEAMFRTMRAEVDSAEPLDDEGLDDHEQGLQAGIEARSSERVTLRLCDGASASDGEEARQASNLRRSGSPQEWRSAGQSDRQSRVDGEAGTRRTPKAGLSRDVPALSGGVPDARPCPHCGSDTEWTTPDTVPATVLDCFAGAGTTLLVADRLQRSAVGIELNAAYTEMAMERVKRDAPLFADLAPAQEPAPEPSPSDLFTWMDAAQ